MEIKLLGITVCSVRTHLYIQFSYQSTIKKTIVKKQNTSKKHAIFVCFAQRRCQNHLTTMVATYRQGEQGVVLKYILLCKRKWFAYVNPRPEIDEVNFQMKLHTVVKI